MITVDLLETTTSLADQYNLPIPQRHGSRENKIAWIEEAKKVILELKRKERQHRKKFHKKRIKKDIERRDEQMDQNQIKPVLDYILERNSGQITIMKSGDTITTDPAEMLEIQRKFFADIATSTTPSTPERTNLYRELYPPKDGPLFTTNQKFQHIMDPISLGELRKACNHMANGKSPGIDKLGSEHFKMLDDTNLTKFLRILNSWLTNAALPDQAKNHTKGLHTKGHIRFQNRQQPTTNITHTNGIKNLQSHPGQKALQTSTNHSVSHPISFLK